MNRVDGFDIFVSYAHADANAVKPLVEALRGHGIRVWYDESAIATFHSITRAITEGIARSKILLAFYSEAYPTRPACQWELSAAFVAAQRSGNPTDRILVINPSSKADHIQPVELRDALFATAANSTELDKLTNALTSHIARLDGVLGDIGVLEPSRWLGNRSIGSTEFVGRVNDLWRAHSALNASEFPVITDRVGSAVVQIRGLGGVGKTLLAQEYARRFGAAYPGGVFWLRAYGNEDTEMTQAERESARIQQIAAFATALGLPAAGSAPEEIESLLVQHMERQGQPCLWIVDDVPEGLTEPELQRWFAPHPLGKTLLTTRTREYEVLALPVDLGVLPPDDALRLLTLHRKPMDSTEEEAAVGIVSNLGGHALALHVAAGWLRSAPETRFADLREDLADSEDDELEFAAQLADALPAGHTASIATTLKRSIDRLSTDAQDFLSLASMLAAAPIPAEIVSSAFRFLYQLKAKQARKRAQLAQRHCDLLSLSEVTGEGGGARTIHTLVARTVRFRERDTERPKLFRMLAVAVVMKALVEAGVGREAPALLQSQLTAGTDPAPYTGFAQELLEETVAGRARGGRREPVYLEALASHGRELTHEISSKEEFHLQRLVALNDLQIGAYKAAMDKFTTLWLVLSDLFGDDDPLTISTKISLSQAMYKLGSRVARGFAEDAAAAARRVWGDEHPGTLLAKGNLASIMKQQMREEDITAARELEVQILEVQRRILGNEHPDTLIIEDNLASTLHALSELRQDRDLLQQARELHEKHLEAFRRLLGPDDPTTLTAMTNLAGALVDEGELFRACEIFERALESTRRVLGDKHPDTIRVQVSLARTLYALGEERAFGMIEQTARAARKVLGSHPDTLTAVALEAAMLRSRGELDDARRLGEEVMEKYRGLYGIDHKPTIIAMEELVRTMQVQGDMSASTQVTEEMIAVRQRVFVDNDPVTLTWMTALESTYYDLGDYEAAVRIGKQTYETLVRSLGETHPNALGALSNLASSYLALGEFQEARRLSERVVELRVQTQGQHHADTIDSKANLLALLLTANDIEAARNVQSTIKNSLDVMQQSAEDHVIKGEYTEALALYEQLVGFCSRIFGETHVNTLFAMGSLVGLLTRLEEYERALPLYASLIETSKKLHGEEHPYTKTLTGLYAQTLVKLGGG